LNDCLKIQGFPTDIIWGNISLAQQWKLLASSTPVYMANEILSYALNCLHKTHNEPNMMRRRNPENRTQELKLDKINIPVITITENAMIKLTIPEGQKSHLFILQVIKECSVKS
jgi:hypothetical protein